MSTQHLSKGARLWIVPLFAIALPWAAAASPHHGSVGYSFSRTITLHGMVTTFDWSNPHCLLHLDVKDESGEVERWTIEMSSPTRLARLGWTKQAFKAGDQVAIDVHPAKNGILLGINSSNAFILKTVVNGKALPVQ